jgi:uncharacterized protein (DUF305 family)
MPRPAASSVRSERAGRKSTIMNTHSRAIAAAAPLAIALALAGCVPAAGPGGGHGMDHDPRPSVSASAEGITMADQMFVMMMIPHHQQAIEMSDIVLAKEGVDPRVAELAERIRAAQAPEIELMQGWLEEWGLPDHGSASGGMGHGDGMMSESDMAALRDADGAPAGQLFLEQMIVHHEGAIDMAEGALRDAQDPDVEALAEKIIDDQTAEIAEMQDLLADL